MSAGPSLGLAARLPETRRGDPRLHQRYPRTLDVEYKLLRNGRFAPRGFGKTVNISYHGVLLSVNDSLPIGGLIDLAIDWPMLMKGHCPLKLKIHGRIVRSDVKGIAVQIRHRAFHTAGAPKRVADRPETARGTEPCMCLPSS
jgi:hypothetical protein